MPMLTLMILNPSSNCLIYAVENFDVLEKFDRSDLLLE